MSPEPITFFTQPDRPVEGVTINVLPAVGSVVGRWGGVGEGSGGVSEGEREDYEEQPFFIGCTCDHDPGQHGWGSCDVDGCDCEGGWEE